MKIAVTVAILTRALGWSNLLAVAGCLIAVEPACADATSWPARQVHLVVPTPPGGSIDATARILANKLQVVWGQSVVVDNRPGASMRIGAEAVAKASPDGYTLLVAHDGALSMNAVVYKNLPYQPQRDFEPLPLIATAPEVFLTNVKTGAGNVQDFIAAAKRNPGKLTNASGGTNSLLYLELLKSIAGVDILSVPYNGGAPAINAVIAGDVDMMIADLGTANPALQSPSVRAIAVTSAGRSGFLTNLPTMQEAGVPGYEGRAWIGVFAPAGTPREVLVRLEADIAGVMRESDFIARLAALRMVPGNGKSSETRDIVAADIEKWGKVVRERHIEIDQN